MLNLFSKFVNRYEKMPLGVKAALWFTICSFLQQGVSFLVTPIFTRLMSTEEYGIYSVFNSWKSILSVFITLQLAGGGFAKGLLKFPNRDRYQSSLMFLTTISIVVWGSAFILAGDVFAEVLELPTKYLFAMIITLLFHQSFSLWAGRQRFEYKYKSLVALTLTTTICAPCLSVAAIKIGIYSVDARIFSLAVVSAAAYGPIMVMMFVKGKCVFDKRIWGYALPFGLAMIPHALANTVLASSDRIMISRMIGDSEAALYNVGYTIAHVIIIFIQSIMGAFTPWMMIRIDKNNFENVAKITNALGMLFCLISLIPILAGPEVVAIMGGDKYAKSIWTIPPVAASIYFVFLHCLFSVVQFYYEKKIFILSASCSAAILNVILNYFFIGKFGYLAAAYTTLVCYAGFSLVDYVFLCKLRRENGVNDKIYDYTFLALMSAGVTLIAILGNLLYLNSVVRYILFALTTTLLLIKRKFFMNLYLNLKQR